MLKPTQANIFVISLLISLIVFNLLSSTFLSLGDKYHSVKLYQVASFFNPLNKEVKKKLLASEANNPKETVLGTSTNLPLWLRIFQFKD